MSYYEWIDEQSCRDTAHYGDCLTEADFEADQVEPKGSWDSRL